MLQITVITTSLLSFSWGAVCYKFDNEHEKFAKHIQQERKDLKLRNYVLDMTWNVIAISARVLALALFASQFLPIAIGLIVAQIIVFSLAELYKDSGVRDLGHQLIDRLVTLVLVLMLAMSSVLNILLTDIFGQDVSWMRSYRFYSRYWRSCFKVRCQFFSLVSTTPCLTMPHHALQISV